MKRAYHHSKPRKSSPYPHPCPHHHHHHHTTAELHILSLLQLAVHTLFHPSFFRSAFFLPHGLLLLTRLRSRPPGNRAYLSAGRYTRRTILGQRGHRTGLGDGDDDDDDWWRLKCMSRTIDCTLLWTARRVCIRIQTSTSSSSHPTGTSMVVGGLPRATTFLLSASSSSSSVLWASTGRKRAQQVELAEVLVLA